MEKEGYLEDGIFDWMLLHEDFDSAFEDYDLNFEIVPNEEAFIEQIAEEMKSREKAEIENEEKKKPEITPVVKKPAKGDK